MQKEYPKAILDGMYLLENDIESLSKREIPCLRFNEGKFIGKSTFDINSIDAYALKKFGITVKEKETGSLDYTVDFDILIRKMWVNLNAYWYKWVNDYRRFPSIKHSHLLFSLKAVEWGVLGVTRLYYTFRERDITSKVGAGEYALQNVPQRWHIIIKESMRLRKNNQKSYYKSIFERRNDALNYIDYIILESNKLFEQFRYR